MQGGATISRHVGKTAVLRLPAHTTWCFRRKQAKAGPLSAAGTVYSWGTQRQGWASLNGAAQSRLTALTRQLGRSLINCAGGRVLRAAARGWLALPPLRLIRYPPGVPDSLKNAVINKSRSQRRKSLGGAPCFGLRGTEVGGRPRIDAKGAWQRLAGYVIAWSPKLTMWPCVLPGRGALCVLAAEGPRPRTLRQRRPRPPQPAPSWRGLGWPARARI